MIFESHAHYDDEAFDTDREELLAQCQRGDRVYCKCEREPEYGEEYPGVGGAVSVHVRGGGRSSGRGGRVE